MSAAGSSKKRGGCDENVVPDHEKAKFLEQTCCQNVKIPPLLPPILKAFTKAVIRTQPKNLLTWSLAYFRAMENGEIPPVKDRLEFPAVEADTGLSSGSLRVLNKQLGNQAQVPLGLLREKWRNLCLDECKLLEALGKEGIKSEKDSDMIDWNRFLVYGAASIAKQDTAGTMKILCAVLTPNAEAKDEIIPFQKWIQLYTVEATRKNISPEKQQAVKTFVQNKAAEKQGNISPKDFADPGCPPLS